MKIRTDTIAHEALRTAQVHEHKAPMRCSAALCTADAEAAIRRGEYRHAYAHALESLRYSLGTLHAEYARIKALGKAAELLVGQSGE